MDVTVIQIACNNQTGEIKFKFDGVKNKMQLLGILEIVKDLYLHPPKEQPKIIPVTAASLLKL